MDRFSTHEDVEWAKGSFDDGAEARIFGYGLDQCPSEDAIGTFAANSWRAGWCDADGQISSYGGPLAQQDVTPQPKSEVDNASK